MCGTDGFPILINAILNGNLIKTHRNVKAYRPILVDIHRFSVRYRYLCCIYVPILILSVIWKHHWVRSTAILGCMYIGCIPQIGEVLIRNFHSLFFILLLRQSSIIDVIWNSSPVCTILVVRAYLNCSNHEALLAVDNNIVINMTGSCFITSIFSLLNICVHLTFLCFHNILFIKLWN